LRKQGRPTRGRLRKPGGKVPKRLIPAPDHVSLSRADQNAGAAALQSRRHYLINLLVSVTSDCKRTFRREVSISIARGGFPCDHLSAIDRHPRSARCREATSC